MRDLFGSIVVVSFMVANGIVLHQNGAEVKALQQENQLLATKVARLDGYSANDYMAISGLREQVAKLEQNCKPSAFGGDMAILDERLDDCIVWIKQIGLMTSDILGEMRRTIQKNAALTSIGLNDVSLSCSQLLPDHTGNLYASDGDGNLSVLGERGGETLELAPDIKQEIDAIKSDIHHFGLAPY